MSIRHRGGVAGSLVRPLLAGGNLFTPDLGTYWPSEFGGRAGGLMGLKPSNYVATSANDVLSPPGEAGSGDELAGATRRRRNTRPPGPA